MSVHALNKRPASMSSMMLKASSHSAFVGWVTFFWAGGLYLCCNGF